VPDSVLNKNVVMGEMNPTAVDPRGLTTPFPGDITAGFNTPASNYHLSHFIFIIIIIIIIFIVIQWNTSVYKD